MSDDIIHQRGKALEDQFFREKDLQLLEKLRSEVQAAETRKTLADISGISDDKTLDLLLSLGIQGETVLCLSLVPLVAMAWADDRLELAEREAVLAAAVESGVAQGTPSYELLKSWMQNKPGTELLNAWKAYISALRTRLDASSLSQMKNTILHRSRQIAQASGGIFGMARVSGSERHLLDELEAQFG